MTVFFCFAYVTQRDTWCEFVPLSLHSMDVEILLDATDLSRIPAQEYRPRRIIWFLFYNLCRGTCVSEKIMTCVDNFTFLIDWIGGQQCVWSEVSSSLASDLRVALFLVLCARKGLVRSSTSTSRRVRGVSSQSLPHNRTGATEFPTPPAASRPCTVFVVRLCLRTSGSPSNMPTHCIASTCPSHVHADRPCRTA